MDVWSKIKQTVMTTVDLIWLIYLIVSGAITTRLGNLIQKYEMQQNKRSRFAGRCSFALLARLARCGGIQLNIIYPRLKKLIFSNLCIHL